MKIIDGLVFKAIQMGKNSDDFKNGAQKNANASWMFGIISIVVWIYVSPYWAILPILITLYSIVNSLVSTKISIELEKLLG